VNTAELYHQMLFYLRALWRRRWYSIAVAWLVCIVGWLWVARMPDVYLSSARVYVDTDTMLGPLMHGLAVDTNIFRQVDIMQRTLLSRPNLEKVARMTDLDLQVENSGDMEKLLDSLKARITIGSQGANLFTISHKATDPDLAKRVVQALLTIFVESNLGASRKDMDQARRFIDEQIRQYEEELNAAEQRVADFKRRNMGTMPSDGSNYYKRMEEAQTALGQTTAMLSEIETKRDELAQQLKDVPQFLEYADNTVGAGEGPQSPLELRALELEQKIDDLRLRYTDKHPDVVAARRLLDSIYKQMDDADAAAIAAKSGEGGPAGATQGPTTKAPNPLYDKIKLKLVEANTQIAILKRRVDEIKGKITNLREAAQTVIAKETELGRLNRDYSVIKTNYEKMLSRREAAKIAQDLETKANKVQFRVIDPPKVPVEPAGPNRLLFLSVVLVGGLGAGVAFGFVLSQIDDSFPSTSRVKEVLAYPVLGAISRIVSVADRRRRVFELSSFTLIWMGLIGAYGGLVAIEKLPIFHSV